MPETVALDTNFIISILIKRNNTERALNILSETIERYEKIFVANQVIAETVYVLEGLHKYNGGIIKLEKYEIKDYVFSIINTPKVVIENKKTIEKALEIYINKNINFGDALIAAVVMNKGIKKIITFDKDFLKIEDLIIITDI